MCLDVLENKHMQIIKANTQFKKQKSKSMWEKFFKKWKLKILRFTKILWWPLPNLGTEVLLSNLRNFSVYLFYRTPVRIVSGIPLRFKMKLLACCKAFHFRWLRGSWTLLRLWTALEKKIIRKKNASFNFICPIPVFFSWKGEFKPRYFSGIIKTGEQISLLLYCIPSKKYNILITVWEQWVSIKFHLRRMLQ